MQMDGENDERDSQMNVVVITCRPQSIMTAVDSRVEGKAVHT